MKITINEKHYKEYQIRKINKTVWYATVTATSWENAEEIGHTDLDVNWELQTENDDIDVMGSPNDHEVPNSGEHYDPY